MAIQFTSSARAQQKIAMGRAFLDQAKGGKTTFGEKISNVNRLKMTQTGIKLLMKGTMERNKLKQKKGKQRAK